jgi:hypothetical protein
MSRNWIEHHKYAILFFIILTIYSGYCIGKVYGFVYFPDEFGYWTYAARAAGYDWSDIATLGSYYSYGYSLVLFPIFKIFTDAVTAYRVAVGLNFVLIGVSYVLIAWLGRKLLGLGENESYITAAVAALYPGVVFYAKTTMVEVMLSVMYIVICALLYYYIENNKPWVFALLITSLVYIHFLHMRAVGVLLAGILALIIYKVINLPQIKNKKYIENFLIAVLAIGLAIMAGFIIKAWVQKIMYGGDVELLSTNDYTGQLGKIKLLFTKDGIIDFIEGLAGKMLYMGLATYGLAWFGIGYLVKRRQNIVCLFILLSTVAELLVSAIYNIRSGRADGVIYGRYHEFVFPILLLMGIYEVWNTSRRLIKTLILVIAQLPMAYLAVRVIEKYELTAFNGYFASGISLLYGIGDNTPTGFVWKAYISGCILTCIVVALAALYKSGKSIRKYLLYGIVVIELLYVVRVSQVYTDGFERAASRDMAMAAKVLQLRNEDDSRRIIYIPTGGADYISILQFAMRDETIEIIDDKGSLESYDGDEIKENDILVLKFNSQYIDEALNIYNCGVVYGHFYIFYNK